MSTLNLFNKEVTTPSSKIMLNFRVEPVFSKDIFKFLNKEKFSQLCKNGCINYGIKWSCPPAAPSFAEFASPYRSLLLCLLYVNLNQFYYIKNNYLKVKAANSILKSRIERLLRSQTRGKHILTGSCRLCKPCRCKLKKPCAHPDKMSYSFEALGIDVSNMIQTFFQHELLWYSKGHLPQYTSVVAGWLTNEKIDAGMFVDEFNSI